MSSAGSPTQNAPSSTAQNYTARRRLEALIEGLSSPADFERKPTAPHTPSPTITASGSADSNTSEPLPTIRTYAGPSAGPRTKDKVVIVTGANSAIGIGRAAASQFAQNGARAVYVCDWNNEHLETQKRELEAENTGCTIHPVKLDVGDEEAVKAVIEDAVTRYGRLDVVFANAGVSGTIGSYDTIDADEFMSVMRVNALGVFLCFKQGAIAMKKCIKNGSQVGGSLIGTASVAGLRSNAGGTAYSASKATVVSMAQTMSYQLIGTGIRVNALCPGLIDTGMTAPVFDFARARGTAHKIGQINPTQRGGIADEIARVALFLGSDEASYVNGQAWAVCGGLSAGHPFVPGKIA